MSQIRVGWPPQGLPSAIQSGTLVDRPVAAVANRYYWATDIYVLFRDTGAAWEVVAGQPYVRMLSNIDHTGAALTSQAFGALGTLQLSPFQVPFTVTIDRLAYAIGATAAGNTRQGLYRAGSFGWPDLPDGGALVCETGSLAMPGASRVHFGTVPDTQLTPGLYFHVLNYDDAAGVRYVASVPGRLWDHNVDGNVNAGRTVATVYGAFPNLCPAPTGGNIYALHIAYMRVKSIP